MSTDNKKNSKKHLIKKKSLSPPRSKTHILKKKDFMDIFTQTYEGDDSDDEEIHFKKGLNLGVLCSNKIDNEWVSNVLLNEPVSHVAVVMDSDKAKRGICIFNISGRGKKRQCYIHLVCRAPSTRMKTRRGKIIKRGKDIMLDIINFAKEKNCKKVKLSALFHVVGYYYKVLGFRFAKKNNRYSDEQMLEAAKQASIIDSIKDEVTFQELPRPLRTHMKGVYKQTGRVALNQEDYESLVEHQEYVLSNGIAMELDLSNKGKSKTMKKMVGDSVRKSVRKTMKHKTNYRTKQTNRTNRFRRGNSRRR